VLKTTVIKCIHNFVTGKITIYLMWQIYLHQKCWF